MSNENEQSALIVTRRPAKELVDGTLRVQIDVEPNDRRLFLDLFPDVGDPMAVAKLSDEVVRAHQQKTAFADPPKKKSKGDHGQFAKWLVQVGFFRRVEVWKMAGRDSDYLEWLKSQKCCVVAGKKHEGDIVPAHVRRIASGAGTGIKPEYSAVPMCDFHHKLQHSKGESGIGGKEFIDRQRVKHLERWSRERIRERMGFASWSEISPAALLVHVGDGFILNIPQEYLSHG